MAKTSDDLDLISGYSDLAKKSRIDPQQRYALNVLEGDTGGSRLGILAKGLAGAMLARQAGQQNAQALALQQQEFQERQRAADILKQHEDEGLDEDFTFKSMLQEYTRTGNKLYLNLATKLKPSVASSGDATMKLSRLAKAKRTLISTKYGSPDILGEQDLAKAQADPEIMWINKQIEEIVSGKNVTSGSSPTTGTRQDQNQDVNGFEDLALPAKAAISTAFDTGGGSKFLSQAELKKQKEKSSSNGAALKDAMEGKIAKNPKTGQRIIRRGGKWQKL